MPRNFELEHDREVPEGASLTTAADLGTHERSPEEDEGIATRFNGMQDAVGHVEVVDETHGTDTPEIVMDLHPYAQVLGLQDLESCVKLEDAAFPPEHRCSREKFQYRLTKCSSLSLGLFTSAGPNAPQQDAATASTANAPDSFSPDRKGILIAHIIATKTTNDGVMDEDMEIPRNWETDASSEPHVGHKEHGRNLAIHSLAVLPQYQGKGLGTILMKAYIQRMVEADVADMISILTYDKLVPYYEKLGFMNEGRSQAKFGGGGWVDMVLDFEEMPSDDEEEDEY